MLLTQITNKESIIGIGEFYLSQLRTIARRTASQLLKNWSREAGFSAVLYLVRTKNIKQVVDSFSFQKKRSDIHNSHGLGTWGSTGTAVPGQKFLLLGNGPFSLLIKADVQCIFDRTQSVSVAVKFRFTHV